MNHNKIRKTKESTSNESIDMKTNQIFVSILIEKVGGKNEGINRRSKRIK